MYTELDVIKIAAELCSGAAPLFPQSKIEAILLGSHTRSDAQPDPDIDVLLLVDTPHEDISARNWQVGDLAAEFLMNHGIMISPTVENRDHFNANLEVPKTV